MASPNSTFTELVTSTFRKVRRDVKDNLSNRNALLKHMYKRGNYRSEDGGLTIVTPLDYAENSTYQRYSDWDLLNIGASDVISAAEYRSDEKLLLKVRIAFFIFDFASEKIRDSPLLMRFSRPEATIFTAI